MFCKEVSTTAHGSLSSALYTLVRLCNRNAWIRECQALCVGFSYFSTTCILFAVLNCFPFREKSLQWKVPNLFKKKIAGISSHFIDKNTRNERADRNSSRSKLYHPLFIFLQVCCRDRLCYFLKSQLKVSSGHGHLELLFRECTDLFWTEAIDSPSHGHQGCIPKNIPGSVRVYCCQCFRHI